MDKKKELVSDEEAKNRRRIMRQTLSTRKRKNKMEDSATLVKKLEEQVIELGGLVQRTFEEGFQSGDFLGTGDPLSSWETSDAKQALADTLNQGKLT